MHKFKFSDKEYQVYEWVDGEWLSMGSYAQYGIAPSMSDSHKSIVVERVLYQS